MWLSSCVALIHVPLASGLSTFLSRITRWKNCQVVSSWQPFPFGYVRKLVRLSGIISPELINQAVPCIKANNSLGWRAGPVISSEELQVFVKGACWCAASDFPMSALNVSIQVKQKPPLLRRAVLSTLFHNQFARNDDLFSALSIEATSLISPGKYLEGSLRLPQ